MYRDCCPPWWQHWHAEEQGSAQQRCRHLEGSEGSEQTEYSKQAWTLQATKKLREKERKRGRDFINFSDSFCCNKSIGDPPTEGRKT